MLIRSCKGEHIENFESLSDLAPGEDTIHNRYADPKGHIGPNNTCMVGFSVGKCAALQALDLAAAQSVRSIPAFLR